VNNKTRLVLCSIIYSFLFFICLNHVVITAAPCSVGPASDCPDQRQSQVRITFDVTTQNIAYADVECLVFYLPKNFVFTPELQLVADLYFPQLQSYMEDNGFIGEANTYLFIPTAGANCDQTRVTRLLFLGLGEPTCGYGMTRCIDIEQFRQATGNLIRVAQTNAFSNIAISLPSALLFGTTAFCLAKQLSITLYMAIYQFDQFITDETRKLNHIFEILVGTTVSDVNAVSQALPIGAYVGSAVNLARYWTDLPAAILTPIRLASDATRIANKHGFCITVLDRQQIVDLGMGGLAATSQGNQDCRFVIMEYKTAQPAPTIAFVGKGITFDSGGLNLKTEEGLLIMKMDMAGAAVVIAAMDAVGYLKPAINIVCIAPLSENMPSDTATKPGDIVKFYNCKTAEIVNADAEGRLVLADALAYATKNYELDGIIDLGTLTYSCIEALGPFYSGLFSNNCPFLQKIQYASCLSGDRAWLLPLCDIYKPSIASDVADMQNLERAGYHAGATACALFLQNFVDTTPWAHLDIAGTTFTAFNVSDISYYRSNNATGAGVRLLVELVMNWNCDCCCYPCPTKGNEQGICCQNMCLQTGALPNMGFQLAKACRKAKPICEVAKNVVLCK